MGIENNLKGIPHEKIGTGIKISYFKPGLGNGGATFSDLIMLDLLNEAGAQVTVVTGYVNQSVIDRINARYPIELVPILDRNTQNPSGDLLVRSILDEIYLRARESDVLLFSQAFSGDAPHYSEAVSRITPYESWLRSHDIIRNVADFKRLKQSSRAFPTTKIQYNQMKQINPDIDIMVVPEFIDTDRLDSLNTSINIRKKHNIAPDDILIIQPTRVAPNKRIDRAIALAYSIQTRIQKAGNNRTVHLIISGGNESEEYAKEEKSKLDKLAKHIGFENITYLGWTNRISDYIRVADLVTFMSDVEGWGMPPLEAAYLSVPCIVHPYFDPLGRPIYKEVYEGFDFIEEISDKELISSETVHAAMTIIDDPIKRVRLVAHNKLSAGKYSKDSLRLVVNSLLINQQNRLRRYSLF